MLALEPESYGMSEAYLTPTNSRVEKWRHRLREIPGFKIGIHWQGNRAHKGDRYRSFALRQFLPLSKIPGVSLVSLQHGYGREQIAELADEMYIHDFTDEMDADGAFTDTIAAMKSLDLVISCDSAACHVAGASNVPIWIPLTFAPDWRWLLGREDSIWYPSARLFRQTKRGDWESVFQTITREVIRRMYS